MDDILVMITPQNVFRHEFIGLPIEVALSSHAGYEGIKGKVVDETKNTIKIEDDNGNRKIIPKKVEYLNPGPSIHQNRIRKTVKV